MRDKSVRLMFGFPIKADIGHSIRCS